MSDDARRDAMLERLRGMRAAEQYEDRILIEPPYSPVSEELFDEVASSEDNLRKDDPYRTIRRLESEISDLRRTLKSEIKRATKPKTFGTACSA